MKAVFYEAFQSPPRIATLPDPEPAADGVVIAVRATGVCRSDWHGWMGHDPDIALPHVPGHELAGEVVAVGNRVQNWKLGDRVTVPFVLGCGHCRECRAGHHQVCDDQFQPGFTHWGSFAEFTSIARADINLVSLPETVDYATAASLGCRFVTSFRAVVDQGRARAGEWVAVHGCGGVGLSAVMIAAAAGANVIAVDISDDRLELARQVGAVATVNGRVTADVVQAIRDLTDGGAHLSLDALGHPDTCFNSISCLRKRGRHVQVGLMLAEHATPKIPMARVIGHELEILGSHGMQAFRYQAVMDMIAAGSLKPELLVGDRISLEESIAVLTGMGQTSPLGVTVVDRF